MTGFIYNNNSYNVGYGSSKIEYAGKGDSTLGYSMYGENIPEKDVNYYLDYINITDNTVYYSSREAITTVIDYKPNTNHYIEIDCLMQPYGCIFTHSNSSTILYPYASFIYYTSTLEHIINYSGYPNSSYYSVILNSSYIPNTRTLWGLYQGEIYKNNVLETNVTKRNTYSSAIISAENTRLFISPESNNGFNGDFYSFKVYSDNTKTTLLHNYRPYLKDNDVIIKDQVTGNEFILEGDHTKITPYEELND